MPTPRSSQRTGKKWGPGSARRSKIPARKRGLAAGDDSGGAGIIIICTGRCNLRVKSNFAISVLLIVAIVGAKPAAAQSASASSVVDQLKAQYKLAKRGMSSSGSVRVDPGIVLVVQQGGITGVPVE